MLNKLIVDIFYVDLLWTSSWVSLPAFGCQRWKLGIGPYTIIRLLLWKFKTKSCTSYNQEILWWSFVCWGGGDMLVRITMSIKLCTWQRLETFGNMQVHRVSHLKVAKGPALSFPLWGWFLVGFIGCLGHCPPNFDFNGIFRPTRRTSPLWSWDHRYLQYPLVGGIMLS